MSKAPALIAKKGVYRMSMELYHGQPTIGPSISSSGLRTIFTDSPAHYWKDSSLNPKRVIQPDPKHFILGRAAHHLLLGEDNFKTNFIMRPAELNGKPWHGQRTDCKEWLARQAKQDKGVLTPDQVTQIRGMARELAAHPLVGAGILNGRVELSLIWQDRETGIWLKSRPDVIPNDSGDFADLKSTADSGEDLDKAISKYRYDVQAVLTKWGAKEVLGIEMTSFCFVFVLSEEPHCVEVLQLDPKDIEAAELDARMALRVFKSCVDSGNWFSPGGSQQDARWAQISDWSKRHAEYRRALLEREIAKPINAPLGP